MADSIETMDQLIDSFAGAPGGLLPIAGTGDAIELFVGGGELPELDAGTLEQICRRHLVSQSVLVANPEADSGFDRVLSNDHALLLTEITRLQGEVARLVGETGRLQLELDKREAVARTQRRLGLALYLESPTRLRLFQEAAGAADVARGFLGTDPRTATPHVWQALRSMHEESALGSSTARQMRMHLVRLLGAVVAQLEQLDVTSPMGAEKAPGVAS